MQTLLRPLSMCLLAGIAAAQGASGTVRPEPFEHLFGAPGQPGSYRAKFIREGAGLFFLQATDHYVSLDAAKKAAHDGNDWLLLAFNGGAADGLRLSSTSPTPLPVDPASAQWNVKADGGVVTFTLDLKNGLELEKVMRHAPQQRGFTLEFAVRNSGTMAGTLDLTLGGLTLVAPHESSLFGNLTGALAVAPDGTTQNLVPTAGVVQPLVIDGKNLLFAGTTNRFFGAFVWPLDDVAKGALTGAQVDTLPPRDDADTNTRANTTLRARYELRLPIPAQGETRAKFGLYVGPKSFRVFDTLPEPERFAAAVDHDLASPCCGIEVPGGRTMAKFLLWLLAIFHDFARNWGIAIMMLTILVRGALAPLNFHMQRSMRAYGARMAVLKPKLDAIKQKHGDDKTGYQQAMVAFQREHKLLPPLGGCLPIVLTMPIYIGLFTALRTAYDVRQQPFLWIEDLSRPDALFALPFWPDQFNLLPLVWIGMFLWLQLRTPLPADPQQRQMMSIMRYMPIAFGLMLYNYAGALLVYMVTSMLWSVVESAVIKRILGPLDPSVAAMTPTTI